MMAALVLVIGERREPIKNLDAPVPCRQALGEGHQRPRDLSDRAPLWARNDSRLRERRPSCYHEGCAVVPIFSDWWFSS